MKVNDRVRFLYDNYDPSGKVKVVEKGSAGTVLKVREWKSRGRVMNPVAEVRADSGYTLTVFQFALELI